MSLSNWVDDVVPWVIHHSVPFVPLSAVNIEYWPKVKKWLGLLDAEPGEISAIRTVPLVVPSDFQSSSPEMPSELANTNFDVSVTKRADCRLRN